MRKLFKFDAPNMEAQDVTGLTREELYDVIAEWFVDTFLGGDVDPADVEVGINTDCTFGAVVFEDEEVYFEFFNLGA